MIPIISVALASKGKVGMKEGITSGDVSVLCVCVCGCTVLIIYTEYVT